MAVGLPGRAYTRSPGPLCARTPAEHDENEVRKDFTPSERVAIVAALNPQTRESNRGNARSDNCPTAQPTVEEAATRAGFSGEKEYRRARAVVANGAPELVDAMDAGEVSVSAQRGGPGAAGTPARG